MNAASFISMFINTFQFYVRRAISYYLIVIPEGMFMMCIICGPQNRTFVVVIVKTVLSGHGNEVAATFSLFFLLSSVHFLIF